MTPSTRLPSAGSALRERTFRVYALAQLASFAGTWTQITAQAWLVVRLGGGGVELGLLAAAQHLPTLLLGLPAGALADRWDRRRLFALTQLPCAGASLLIGALVAAGQLTLPWLYGAATVFGIATAVENPVRHALVGQTVSRENLRSAVGVSGVILSAGNFLGPVVAGVLLSFGDIGTSACFMLNAATFLAVAAASRVFPASTLDQRGARVAMSAGLAESVREILRSPALSAVVASLFVVGFFALNFQVLLPLVVDATYANDPQVLAAVTAGMGLGATAGALVVGGHPRIGAREAGVAALVLGGLIALVALPRSAPLTTALFLLIGFAVALYLASVHLVLQSRSRPDLRGRIVGLYSLGLVGLSPVSGLVLGLLADTVGVGTTLVVAGAGGVAGGAVLLGVLALRRRTPDDVTVEEER